MSESADKPDRILHVNFITLFGGKVSVVLTKVPRGERPPGTTDGRLSYLFYTALRSDMSTGSERYEGSAGVVRDLARTAFIEMHIPPEDIQASLYDAQQDGLGPGVPNS